VRGSISSNNAGGFDILTNVSFLANGQTMLRLLDFS
jgi:hypothetical protein